jgi:hypothetical protein
VLFACVGLKGLPGALLPILHAVQEALRYVPGEQAALRNLNAHLHRIEVITFDQLVRIGVRVMSIFERQIRSLAAYGELISTMTSF